MPYDSPFSLYSSSAPPSVFVKKKIKRINGTAIKKTVPVDDFIVGIVWPLIDFSPLLIFPFFYDQFLNDPVLFD